MTTLYASFTDASSAERAIGALLDQGARSEDLSIVASTPDSAHPGESSATKSLDTESSAKTGLSTTTGADAALGAVKGASIGIGVGALAVLASIFVPGVGLILGGGALATALAGGVATVAGGSVAGGIYGFLRDQGVPEEQATLYNDRFIQGGSIVAVAVPTGNLISAEVEGILVKYGALNVAGYNSMHMAVEPSVAEPPVVPFDTSLNSEIPVRPNVHVVVDASTGESHMVGSPPEGTTINPITGEIEPIPRRIVIVEDCAEAEKSDAKLY